MNSCVRWSKIGEPVTSAGMRSGRELDAREARARSPARTSARSASSRGRGSPRAAHGRRASSASRISSSASRLPTMACSTSSRMPVRPIAELGELHQSAPDGRRGCGRAAAAARAGPVVGLGPVGAQAAPRRRRRAVSRPLGTAARDRRRARARAAASGGAAAAADAGGPALAAPSVITRSIRTSSGGRDGCRSAARACDRMPMAGVARGARKDRVSAASADRREREHVPGHDAAVGDGPDGEQRRRGQGSPGRGDREPATRQRHAGTGSAGRASSSRTATRASTASSLIAGSGSWWLNLAHSKSAVSRRTDSALVSRPSARARGTRTAPPQGVAAARRARARASIRAYAATIARRRSGSFRRSSIDSSSASDTASPRPSRQARGAFFAWRAASTRSQCRRAAPPRSRSRPSEAGHCVHPWEPDAAGPAFVPADSLVPAARGGATAARSPSSG